MPDAPPLLQQAAQTALEELQLLIKARTADSVRLHTDLFRQYREELETLFLTYSAMPEAQPFDPAGPVPTLHPLWNGPAFRRAGKDKQVEASFQELLDALWMVQVDDFQQGLRDAADEGYTRALYLLALGGLDTQPLLDEVPEEWDDELSDDAYDGVDLEGRLSQWNDITQDKVSRWLRASALGGSSLGDTLEGFDRMVTEHTGRVTGLLDNEMFRAYALGAAIAVGTARRTLDPDIAELWVCRLGPDNKPDPLVCLICRSKHLTVTKDRPVDDSHPGCRCMKVPVPLQYNPVAPLSYESFRQGEV